MEMSAISAGLAAIKCMGDIVGNLVEVRDLRAMGDIQVEMNGQLLALQQAMFDLRAALDASADREQALKAKLTAIENAARDRERYALHAIRPGTFVYRLRDGVEPAEPTHYVCQPCMDKGVKAVLELKKFYGLGPSLVCPACDRDIPVADQGE